MYMIRNRETGKIHTSNNAQDGRIFTSLDNIDKHVRHHRRWMYKNPEQASEWEFIEIVFKEETARSMRPLAFPDAEPETCGARYKCTNPVTKDNTTCRGCYALGTACGSCSRCRDELAERDNR